MAESRALFNCFPPILFTGYSLLQKHNPIFSGATFFPDPEFQDTGANPFVFSLYGRKSMKISLAVCTIVAASLSSVAAEKPRVFITDSKSWEISGGVGGSQDAFGGASKGGARPQTAEIIKTFNERCPNVIVNNKQEKADYVILLDHEGGKDGISRDNKVVVFNKDGDAIVSRSTRILGNAVKDACTAISSDWPKQVRARNAEPSNNASAPAVASKKP